MRRALLAAVAAAPLLACFGGAAYAACPTSGATTATAGADITVASGCTINPTSTVPGITLNSNNNVTVASGGSITETDKDNAIAILALGGFTGSVDNEGSISMLESYTAATDNTDGIASGVFATGSGRYGILVHGGT